GNDVMPCLVELGEGKPIAGELGGKVNVPVKIVRREGFKDAIQLSPIGLPAYAKAAPVTVADKPMTLTIELDKAAPVGELTFAVSGVIPKYNYTRNKTDIELANQQKAEAGKAAAAVAKLVEEAKKKAAAMPKEKKADADKLV